MLILKGQNEKSRIIEYIRMGMGAMVHNSVCFEYDESPVIHNSLYIEKINFLWMNFIRASKCIWRIKGLDIYLFTPTSRKAVYLI